MSIMKNSATGRPLIPLAVDVLPPLEADELSRFKGPAVPSLERGEIPKRLRRLKRNELVNRGDFVADAQRGFERWEGPGGFRADAFVQPIYRGVVSG